MVVALSAIESLVFYLLSGIHFYWALGGRRGVGAALPEDRSGRRVLNPGPASTALVGAVLLFIALYFTVRTGLIPLMFPFSLPGSVGYMIGALFLLRSVGDFRYVGFFKRVRGTRFARYDTILFSPLTLLLGFCALLIESVG